MTIAYALYDREAEHYEEISQERAEAIISNATLHTGPYGAMGNEIEAVVYEDDDGECFATAIRYRGRWLDIPEHQAPHVQTELSLRGFDPPPEFEGGAGEIDIAVIEAGEDYLHRLDTFTATMSGTLPEMISRAQELVAARGYRVMSDAEGGCCEYVSVSGGDDYIAVTIWPE